MPRRRPALAVLGKPQPDRARDATRQWPARLPDARRAETLIAAAREGLGRASAPHPPAATRGLSLDPHCSAEGAKTGRQPTVRRATHMNHDDQCMREAERAGAAPARPQTGGPSHNRALVARPTSERSCSPSSSATTRPPSRWPGPTRASPSPHEPNLPDKVLAKRAQAERHDLMGIRPSFASSRLTISSGSLDAASVALTRLAASRAACASTSRWRCRR